MLGADIGYDAKEFIEALQEMIAPHPGAEQVKTPICGYCGNSRR